MSKVRAHLIVYKFFHLCAIDFTYDYFIIYSHIQLQCPLYTLLCPTFCLHGMLSFVNTPRFIWGYLEPSLQTCREYDHIITISKVLLCKFLSKSRHGHPNLYTSTFYRALPLVDYSLHYASEANQSCIKIITVGG